MVFKFWFIFICGYVRMVIYFENLGRKLIKLFCELKICKSYFLNNFGLDFCKN